MDFDYPTADIIDNAKIYAFRIICTIVSTTKYNTCTIDIENRNQTSSVIH